MLQHAIALFLLNHCTDCKPFYFHTYFIIILLFIMVLTQALDHFITSAEACRLCYFTASAILLCDLLVSYLTEAFHPSHISISQYTRPMHCTFTMIWNGYKYWRTGELIVSHTPSRRECTVTDH